MRSIRGASERLDYNNNNPRAFDLSISTIHIIICYSISRRPDRLQFKRQVTKVIINWKL